MNDSKLHQVLAIGVILALALVSFGIHLSIRDDTNLSADESTPTDWESLVALQQRNETICWGSSDFVRRNPKLQEALEASRHIVISMVDEEASDEIVIPHTNQTIKAATGMEDCYFIRSYVYTTKERYYVYENGRKYYDNKRWYSGHFTDAKDGWKSVDVKVDDITVHDRFAISKWKDLRRAFSRRFTGEDEMFQKNIKLQEALTESRKMAISQTLLPCIDKTPEPRPDQLIVLLQPSPIRGTNLYHVHSYVQLTNARYHRDLITDAITYTDEMWYTVTMQENDGKWTGFSLWFPRGE